MRRLQYLVTVEVDERKAMDDHVPEELPQAIADEIKSNIESCNGSLGTDECVVQLVGPFMHDI